jgi:hypothetical protein
MNRADQIEIVQVFLGLCLLWAAYRAYRSTATDRLIEDLNSFRDELFDYIKRNNLDPQTRFARELIDTMDRIVSNIGELHKFSVISVVFLRREASVNVSTIESISDPSTREFVRNLNRRINARIADFLFFEGPKAIVFLPIRYIQSIICRPGSKRIIDFDRIVKRNEFFGSKSHTKILISKH